MLLKKFASKIKKKYLNKKLNKLLLLWLTYNTEKIRIKNNKNINYLKF